MSASLKLFVLYSVYLDHLVPLEAVNHGKEGKKEGYIFHKGSMSFIGIIGMNSRYEAEIQILTMDGILIIFGAFVLQLFEIPK